MLRPVNFLDLTIIITLIAGPLWGFHIKSWALEMAAPPRPKIEIIPTAEAVAKCLKQATK